MGFLGEIGSDLQRLREIARVMARHGFAPTMQRIPLLSRLKLDKDNPRATLPVAQRFSRLLEDLGPSFVKVGQILSTRNDLLPLEFTRELSRLQDQVPPFSFEEARHAVERELGGTLEDHFTSFDPVPLASASMAQVHVAKTQAGQDVVVKVLRPGIEEQVRGDSAILVVLAQLTELVVEEAAHYQVSSLAEEFEKGLVNELDFTLEAENLKAFAARNAGREGVHIPYLVEELSTRRVMTMERIFGRRITALLDDERPERAHAIVERLVRVSYEHFFVDGLFHADPHPGNVLITDDDKIAFIDFGLVGRVSRTTQDRLLLVITALALRDPDALSRLLLRVGEVEGRVSLSDFRDAVSRLLERYMVGTVGDVDTSRALTDLLDLSTRFGIRLPREFALLSKASVAVDGIVRALHPGLDPSKMLIERSQTLLVERFDPRSLTGGGMRAALQIGLFVADVPTQISQVLWDLERGNFRVELRSETMEKLERDIRGLGMTIFGAAMAAALTLGGIYVLAREDWRVFGWPVLPIVAFGIAGTMFGVAFTWFLTGGQLPKLSVSALLGRRKSRAEAQGRATKILPPAR
jgi:ubiquinone biosynthesis protein